MSFAAAERATTQPDATTDRAANALRQLRQNVALLERLCDMVDSAGPAGADAELRQQVAVQRGVVEDLTRATRRHLTELLRDAENSPPATAPRRRAAHVQTRVTISSVTSRRRRGGGARSAARPSLRVRACQRWLVRLRGRGGRHPRLKPELLRRRASSAAGAADAGPEEVDRRTVASRAHARGWGEATRGAPGTARARAGAAGDGGGGRAAGRVLPWGSHAVLKAQSESQCSMFHVQGSMINDQ